ncbi:MAG: hypothetical protein AABW81_03940 [Nanoarchaeota archaeon]
MIIKNKRGGEKIISIWEFFVLGVVGLGIVAGVWIFYSSNADVRVTESGILYNKIVDCLIQQGYLNENIFMKDFDFFKECKLSREVLNSKDFYFKINVVDSEGKEIVSNISGERTNFERDCEVSKSIKAEEYPKCTGQKESVIYYQDNKVKVGTIYILTASNQRGEKVFGLSGEGEFGGGGAGGEW